MSELNLLLVGGGTIGLAHAHALRVVPLYFPDAPQWRPRVVCDATPELANAAAARLGFDQGVADWRSAVQRPDIDAVMVATPPDLHHDVAIAALAAGKHVFCEKPLARNAPEAKGMVTAAEQSGRVALAGFNYRCAPALLQARRMVRQGAIGDVHHFSGRYLQSFAGDPSRPMSWRYQAARGGSGALADIGSHVLDLARWLVGDISHVMGSTRTVVAQRPNDEGGGAGSVDVDDYAAFVARFESGALGSFEVSRVASGRGNTLQIELYGSNGALSFDWDRNNELLYFAAQETDDRQGFRRLVAGPRFPAYPAPVPVGGLGIGYMEIMVIQLAEVARAMGGSYNGELATFRDGLAACALVDSVLASSASSQWTEVPRT